MRVSTELTDPGYTTDFFRVVFNGYEVERIITADEEKGIIVQRVVDQYGNAVMRDGEWVTERRRGGVVVEKILF